MVGVITCFFVNRLAGCEQVDFGALSRLVAMAELVQLELDEKDKENFAEMQAAMNEAQRELASLTMRGRTRHAEAKCVQRPPMRSRR